MRKLSDRIRRTAARTCSKDPKASTLLRGFDIPSREKTRLNQYGRPAAEAKLNDSPGELLDSIFSRLKQGKTVSVDDTAKKAVKSKTGGTGFRVLKYRKLFRAKLFIADIIHSKYHSSREPIPVERGWGVITEKDLPSIHLIRPSAEENVSAPTLRGDLDRVMDLDGAVPNFDPKTNRPSFDATLRYISQPDSIRRGSIPEYRPASKDPHFEKVGDESVKFRLSTSSSTRAMSLLYHVISNFKPTDLSGLSSFKGKARGFTKDGYSPVALTISSTDKSCQAFSVDPAEDFSETENVLSKFGEIIERLVTYEDENYSKLFLKRGPTLNGEMGGVNGVSPHPTFHNYSRFEKLLIRSQVDGQRQGSRGIELFDIKSRAVAPTRYHLTRYKQFANYKIQYPRGVTRSYELEFYDMVRSVFMKYAFQLRLGGMSGAFVCFHNTREMLGFEYIRLQEIEQYVFGSSHWAEKAFGFTLSLYQVIMETAVNAFSEYPRGKLRIVMRISDDTGLYLFVHRIPDIKDPLSRKALSNVPIKGDADFAEYLKANGLRESDVKMYYFLIQPYVNGKRVKKPINVTPSDDYQVAHNMHVVRTPHLRMFVESYMHATSMNEFTRRDVPKRARGTLSEDVYC
eukprot:CAMPEP_0113957370 /NCGR_PEP_ID=MMETSP0011_2-20120614/2738_1 /TAXON_ID=101924 /ORGANISM="Rhodosorus marinus" /LENGTH=626 /DNA_ID=CAMNT_0000967937 /DNA_START=164 /DNA_END=2044 /DNA_ORIENTATION=- /assembly_acc=CAM_ASM_000156